ncbi:Hypothetical protein RAK1035_0484 [Roseovarius sp. AK1035]|nr:Hypothetical protein RAK1035_0484 [Roseovarius sp. AK1035]
MPARADPACRANPKSNQKARNSRVAGFLLGPLSCHAVLRALDLRHQIRHIGIE